DVRLLSAEYSQEYPEQYRRGRERQERVQQAMDQERGDAQSDAHHPVSAAFVRAEGSEKGRERQPQEGCEANHTHVGQNFEIQVVGLDALVPRFQSQQRAIQVPEIVWTDAQQWVRLDEPKRSAPQLEAPDDPRRFFVVARQNADRQRA